MSIDLIIPTVDNTEYLYPCVRSILANSNSEILGKIIIVNNGAKGSLKQLESYENPKIVILDQEKNLGWSGGLQAGLLESKCPIVVLMNDDTYVPSSSSDWLERLASHFSNPDVSATGPLSNSSPGFQDMNLYPPSKVLKVPFLVGFCMMVRRFDLDECGGIDTGLGDDIDLSFRLRKAGGILVADRSVFVFHHGGKTGLRLFPNDWDSNDMLAEIRMKLAERYGAEAVKTEYLEPKCEVYA